MEREITAIEAQKRNRQRLNIHLDGEYAFSLDRITAAWLKPGRRLSQAEIDNLLEKDEQESAFTRALHFLSYRARSGKEMETFLSGKGYSEQVKDAVMQRLEQEGYLNDARFCRDWLENRSTFRPRSQSRLRAELQQKGIPTPIIQTAIVQADLDDAALANKAASKVSRRYSALDWKTFRNRVVNHLLRRGFSYGIANGAAQKAWIALHNHEHDDAFTMNMEQLEK